MAAARRVSEPTGRTFGANLGSAAAQHLAPAIRRSFPAGERWTTQTPGNTAPRSARLLGHINVGKG